MNLPWKDAQYCPYIGCSTIYVSTKLGETLALVGDCIKDSRKNIGVSWRSFQQLW